MSTDKNFGLIGAIGAASLIMLGAVAAPHASDDNAPLMLARDGYFYVNAKPANVGGKTYVTDQMYVEERVPGERHILIRS